MGGGLDRVCALGGFDVVRDDDAARDRIQLGATGDIVVTGAAGGVGSIAVALLAAAGYRVLASTGRPQDPPRS